MLDFDVWLSKCQNLCLKKTRLRDEYSFLESEPSFSALNVINIKIEINLLMKLQDAITAVGTCLTEPGNPFSASYVFFQCS